MTSNNQLFSLLTGGMNENGWGYGVGRIKVASKLKHKIPYTFTSCGFKNQNKQWFLCLRMNVDQPSPQKTVQMDISTNLYLEWDKMMEEFANEYAKKSPNYHAKK